MGLKTTKAFDKPTGQRVQIFLESTLLLLFWSGISVFAQTENSRRPELIRDTEASEETADAGNVQTPKEPNPLLAEQNINIGNFYLKKRNYSAAIQRYLDALEYQPNSITAYEALARAYEKSGEVTKAIAAYKELIEKNPESPKISDFRNKLAKLEKKP
jgi:tetratricopeptide (TPR) repeat protein